ncbi:MAG: NAD(P)/FAD-dependent oxidoreductase, partial [Bryobacteraceae bacterium]
PIARRDFLQGAAITSLASGLAPELAAAAEAEKLAQDQQGYYPPTRLGMRGSHPGSFEAAHELRDGDFWNGATTLNDAGEDFDLVAVGGGISGLAAAYFYRQDRPKAKILILDNHDDFGGHAKRNEFRHNGRLLAINGGTLNIEAPQRYNEAAKELLFSIGIDLDRFQSENASNRNLYRSLGLGRAHFFDKETWGVDRLVARESARSERGFRGEFPSTFLAKTPISEQAQKDLTRLYDARQPDYLPGLSSADKKVRLAKMSYQDFLLNFAKVDPQVLWFFRHFGEDVFCVGADATPALFAWQMGQPGFSGLQLDPTPEGVLSELPGVQHGRQKEGGGAAVHFPDGNATVARLLVRWLIPEALPGKTMEDAGAARVNYALLDRSNQSARIRLNSTVLNVRHEGDPAQAREVVVSYSRGGKMYDVRGKACVMACWNMFIPYLAPELPETQKEALAYAVKGPLVYTSVGVKNWKAWQKLGVSYINAPTMYHPEASLTEAVSLGDLKHPQSPEDPIALHLVKIMSSPGKPRKEQHRLGRAELLSTTFETFERNIRDQLARMLGAGGFDAARDIVDITVNRWPHGYAYTYNSLFEPLEWVFTNSEKRPNVIARQPYGLIAIANSDAGASPHTDTALWEAHRAVGDVLNRRAMPKLAE